MLYDIDQASKILGISGRQVQRRAAVNKLERTRQGGKVLYRIPDATICHDGVATDVANVTTCHDARHDADIQENDHFLALREAYQSKSEMVRILESDKTELKNENEVLKIKIDTVRKEGGKRGVFWASTAVLVSLIAISLFVAGGVGYYHFIDKVDAINSTNAGLASQVAIEQGRGATLTTDLKEARQAAEIASERHAIQIDQMVGQVGEMAKLIESRPVTVGKLGLDSDAPELPAFGPVGRGD